MAVVTLYMSDRDSSKTFTDKKSADNYDKVLELAENVSIWMEKSIDGLTEAQIESIGILVAENKDLLVKAIKSKPEVLLQKEHAEENVESNSDKVTKISA